MDPRNAMLGDETRDIVKLKRSLKFWVSCILLFFAALFFLSLWVISRPSVPVDEMEDYMRKLRAEVDASLYVPEEESRLDFYENLFEDHGAIFGFHSTLMSRYEDMLAILLNHNPMPEDDAELQSAFDDLDFIMHFFPNMPKGKRAVMPTNPDDGFDVPKPWIGKERAFGRLLKLECLRLKGRGDEYSQALPLLINSLEMSRDLRKGSLICVMVTVVVENEVFDQMSSLIISGCLGKEELLALMRELPDYEMSIDDARMNMKHEMYLCLKSMDKMKAREVPGMIDPKMRFLKYLPFVDAFMEREKAVIFKSFKEIVEEPASDWMAFRGIMKNGAEDAGALSPWEMLIKGGVLNSMLAPPTKTMGARFAQCPSANRMARIFCALQLWKDEKGAYPKTLDELMAYFPNGEIPTDPFSNKSFHYKIGPEESPILYSVGDNGIDDGGFDSSLDYIFPKPLEKREK